MEEMNLSKNMEGASLTLDKLISIGINTENIVEKNPRIEYEPRKPLTSNSPNLYKKLNDVMNKYHLRVLHTHRGNFPTEDNRKEELNLKNQMMKPGYIYKVEGKYLDVERYCKDNFLPLPELPKLKS